MISRISLRNFRQFDSYEAELNNKLVIIQADNTKGKSSILEAIHILTNHSSPYTSNYRDLFNYNKPEQHFRIEILHEPEESSSKKLAFFQDERQKQFMIDGHKTTKKKFSENLASTIFSPEQIETLMSSSTKRKEYLNSLISKIDLDYSDILNKHTKSLRQRNAYLKKLASRFYKTGEINLEDQQLLYWSETFAKYSSQVTLKRHNFIKRLRDDNFYVEYEPSVDISREKLDQLTDPNLEVIYLDQIVHSLRKDIALGHTTVGAHRDDWNIHSDKDIKKYGSRGEKRMALGRMIFQSQELLSEELGYYPILLLDDISSELDKGNIAKIIEESIKKNQQVIITTINLDSIPKEFVELGLVIRL
jgi:DNA replication and repair protein RecF